MITERRIAAMQTTAKDEIKIRTATPEDAETLAAIYAPYVENTSITFAIYRQSLFLPCVYAF